jgi:hypothetical protein
LEKTGRTLAEALSMVDLRKARDNEYQIHLISDLICWKHSRMKKIFLSALINNLQEISYSEVG